MQAAFDAGVLIVCAAGNNGSAVSYPGAYATAFAVGAVDARLVRPSYSNGGPVLECVAPGGSDLRDVDADGFPDDVLSTIRDETRLPSSPAVRAYGGTSMASPHVAGVAGLILSIHPAITQAQLRATILTTCRDLEAVGFDNSTGFGLLQAGEAIRAALVDLGTPRGDPPALMLSSATLRFPTTLSVGSVYVNNAGGGTLNVTSVVASTDNGLPWLSGLRTAAPPGGASDTDLVVATIDRTGLGDGCYAGSLLVRNGTTPLGILRVVVEVGAQPLGGIGFSVVAIDDATGSVVRSGVAVAETGYRFALRELLPGRYRVHAGTDLDHDGFFCEAPDWCGDFGGAVPAKVDVTGGQAATGIDIELK